MAHCRPSDDNVLHDAPDTSPVEACADRDNSSPSTHLLAMGARASDAAVMTSRDVAFPPLRPLWSGLAMNALVYAVVLWVLSVVLIVPGRTLLRMNRMHRG